MEQAFYATSSPYNGPVDINDTTSTPALDLKSMASTVNEALEAAIVTMNFPDAMAEMIRYALLGPGKRLRPILTMLWAEASGGCAAKATPAAVAIECVHCFSLVHDDLPCMDDDDLRRGRETVHKKYDEALGVLCGDALLAMAMEMIGRIEDEQAASTCTRLLGKATNAMIAGQIMDTRPDLAGAFFADADSDARRLHQTHEAKTGSLFVAACRLGALSGGGNDVESADTAAQSYGGELGHLFQIMDDVLDVTQSSEHLGKTAGKDEQASKKTFVAVHGIEAARDAIAHHADAACKQAQAFGEQGAPLTELIRKMTERTR